MSKLEKDRRNPYLVLGIPYGASKKEVRRSFAKRARQIKNEEFDAYRSEDLNWSLQQLEQAEKDPELDIENFRIPANPNLFQSETEEGFFNPPIKPMDRKSPHLTPWETQAIIDEAVIDWLTTHLSKRIQEFELPYPKPIKENFDVSSQNRN